MPSLDDPEFVEALERLFARREDIKAIAEYQRKLYESLSELHTSHRQVHEHVRTLTESSHRDQSNTDTLIRARADLERLLRNLEQSHAETRTEVRRAAQELYQVQQEIHKVPHLGERLEKLERKLEQINRDVEELKREEREDNRKDDEHDRRLERLERH